MALELSAWLYHLIVFIILVGFVVFFNIVFIIKFQDPEEEGHAYVAKAATLVGLTFAFASVLMLPFDIALRPANQYFMPLVWEIFLIAAAVLVFAVLPFFTYFYENEDEGCGKQLCCGFVGSIVTLGVMAVLILILWWFVGYADVPMRQLDSPILSPNATGCSAYAWQIRNRLATLSPYEYPSPYRAFVHTRMSIPVYAIAIISTIGWVLLVIFGGVGLFALPLDMISDFSTRPRKLSAKEFVKVKTELRDNVRKFEEDLKVFEQLNSGADKKQKGKMPRMLRELQRRCLELEKDASLLTLIDHPKDYNPLVYWLELVGGIFGIIISVIWAAHILIYMAFFKLYPFLNTVFTVLDGAFPYLGIVFYGIFVFYLLWCVVKGASKIGLRFLLFSVHPMKLHGTFMNSFLFNTSLVIITTFALIQFACNCFSVYATNTSVRTLFGNQIKNMWGLTYLWDYYPYVLLGVSVISLVWSVTITTCLKKKAREKQEKSMQMRTIKSSTVPSRV
ncbi:putative LIMR family protein [Paratrimastix pyriformis]|uniref:LIMR family protein n=1 Tax=Paratrimastix pyriformis TaxID=342808 RepID=A0ABQ8UXY3_9EUKA|nr:putative LIMR family protein [Paratrimastix pyriformis]|eukprot:GAFH01001443.1.p1 GENE.GAFH01001443.1~~GAFH01001443.1.p1  ORF type:complete len:521 (-),score=180.18 GAFH01001443.1:65-1582(-)